MARELYGARTLWRENFLTRELFNARTLWRPLFPAGRFLLAGQPRFIIRVMIHDHTRFIIHVMIHDHTRFIIHDSIMSLFCIYWYLFVFIPYFSLFILNSFVLIAHLLRTSCVFLSHLLHTSYTSLSRFYMFCT